MLYLPTTAKGRGFHFFDLSVRVFSTLIAQALQARFLTGWESMPKRYASGEELQFQSPGRGEALIS